MDVLGWALAGPCWIGLDWAAMGFDGLGCVGQARVGSDWAWLACVVLGLVVFIQFCEKNKFEWVLSPSTGRTRGRPRVGLG